MINDITKNKIIDTKYLNIFLQYNLLSTFLGLESVIIRKIFSIERNTGSLTQNVNNLHPVKNYFLKSTLWNIWRINNLFLAAYDEDNEYNNITYSYQYGLYIIYLEIMYIIGSNQNIKGSKILKNFSLKFDETNLPVSLTKIFHHTVLMPFFLPWILKKIQSEK